MKTHILSLILVFAILHLRSQPYKTHTLTTDELELIQLVADLRESFELPPLQISRSLSYIAREHAEQLETQIKQLSYSWTNCKYDPNDSNTYPCMWNKPIEMCDFPAKGFECIYRSSNIADIHAALNKWQSNANTFSLLTSQGAWSKRKWKSIGIGILGSYVTLWLSEGTDPYNYPIKKKLTSE